MGEITFLCGIALLLELLYLGRHIDGVPHHDYVGDQIEAAGLMGQFLAPSAAQLTFVGDEQVGVPVANVQETSICVSMGNAMEENEGLHPHLLWMQPPDYSNGYC